MMSDQTKPECACGCTKLYQGGECEHCYQDRICRETRESFHDPNSLGLVRDAEGNLVGKVVTVF